ncbi:MAG: hypothetical protein IPK60_00040 [Sandaracinaceae bacterium]|nr:hypothetical protein [Sandaracinaceae bacterium]
MNWNFSVLAYGALVVSVAGCATARVRPVSPRPNLVIAADNAPAAIRFGAEVHDDFVIPGNSSIGEVRVDAWTWTLTEAFRNGFRRYQSSSRRISLDAADLSFSPASVNGIGGTVAVTATIRYRARLLDARGATLAETAGTVHARDVTTSASGLTDNAAQAVEAMFEALAREWFVTPPVSPVPTTSPPLSR